jgi:hypothetical protein
VLMCVKVWADSSEAGKGISSAAEAGRRRAGYVGALRSSG